MKGTPGEDVHFAVLYIMGCTVFGNLTGSESDTALVPEVLHMHTGFLAKLVTVAGPSQ